jgi:hypothetical protein
MFLLLAAMLGEVQANSGVKFSMDRVNLSSVPYATVYARCFEEAWMATVGSGKPARDAALEKCTEIRPELIEKYGQSRPDDRLQAKRNLERSLDGIERAYQKASDKKG